MRPTVLLESTLRQVGRRMGQYTNRGPQLASHRAPRFRVAMLLWSYWTIFQSPLYPPWVPAMYQLLGLLAVGESRFSMMAYVAKFLIHWSESMASLRSVASSLKNLSLRKEIMGSSMDLGPKSRSMRPRSTMALPH